MQADPNSTEYFKNYINPDTSLFEARFKKYEKELMIQNKKIEAQTLPRLPTLSPTELHPKPNADLEHIRETIEDSSSDDRRWMSHS